MGGGAGAAEGVVPELVVALAFGVVGEDLVGLGALLEGGLGLGVTRVAVRVVLHRHAPVGAFDLFAVRSAFDAENLVIVAGGGH